MHNLSYGNEFYLHENEKSFPYQRLSTYPRFNTEARGNWEMAYSTTSFRANVVVAKTRYQMLEVLSFCDRERA